MDDWVTKFSLSFFSPLFESDIFFNTNFSFQGNGSFYIHKKFKTQHAKQDFANGKLHLRNNISLHFFCLLILQRLVVTHLQQHLLLGVLFIGRSSQFRISNGLSGLDKCKFL
jgi:hypothetical protein